MRVALSLTSIVLLLPAFAAGQEPPPPDFEYQGPAAEASEFRPRIVETSEILPLITLDNLPRRSEFWFQAEYLIWWIKSGPSPNPLVTGTSTNPPDFLEFGSFRDPGLVVLNGVTPINYSTRAGARFAAGTMLGDAVGLEASGFFLAARSNHFFVTSDADGNPPLFRPFSNVLAGIGTNAAGDIDAFPGLFAGDDRVSSRSETWGVELNLALNLVRGPVWNAGCLVGLRNVNLKEDLTIRDRVTVIDPAGIFPFLGDFFNTPGDSLIAFDRFRTRNCFYGSQVGAWGSVYWGRFGLLAATKLAMGWTRAIINIEGTTTFLPGPGDPVPAQTVPAGILALPTNSGRYTNTNFAVVPELNFQLSFDITTFTRFYVGYRFLYWSNVARPGDQIDIFVNDSQAPQSFSYAGPPGTFPGALLGQPRPQVPYQQADFWVQGLNFGFEFTY